MLIDLADSFEECGVVWVIGLKHERCLLDVFEGDSVVTSHAAVVSTIAVYKLPLRELLEIARLNSVGRLDGADS